MFRLCYNFPTSDPLAQMKLIEE